MAIECSICGKKQSGWIQEYPLDAELYDYKACAKCGEIYHKIIRAEKLGNVAGEIEFIKEKLAENCSNVDKNVEKHFEMIFKVENAEKSYKEIKMGKMCELCGKVEGQETRFGIQLCQECLSGYENIMRNDRDAIQRYAKEEDFPNATINAKQQIISLAKRKLDSGLENLKSKTIVNDVRETQGEKNRNEKISEATDYVKQQTSEPETKRPAVKPIGNHNPYKLKYEKVLSTQEKREWIENYVNIKRFVSLVWACLGLGIGFLVGRLLGYGMDFTMFVLIFIGGGIGGVLGTNSVGAAMMQAIAAEQSIVNEELLTEILNKLEEE